MVGNGAPSVLGEPAFQGLSLDWKRFVTYDTADFIKAEIKALRKYSDKPVTTNCMDFFPGLDYYELCKDLDFYSNDIYPYWAGGTAEDGITLRKREGDGENYYFILNETDEEKIVTLDKAYKNVLTEEAISSKQTLPPCGFLILTDH